MNLRRQAELREGNPDIRVNALGSSKLREIDKGNPDAIAALTELIRTSEDESILRQGQQIA
jgi:hypothetical protein